jgi:hypothetical protein
MSNTDALSPTGFAIMGSRPPRPRTVWLLAHLRALWLDRQLAAGIVPWHSKLHAVRSLQLTSDRSRRALARSLEHLVEHAEMSRIQSVGTAVVIPCREQVREARPVILAIAVRLRATAPVDARGTARLRLLLTDGTGPCYTPSGRPDALAVELQTVDRWLDAAD